MGLRHAAALALIALGTAAPSAESDRVTPGRALMLARVYLSAWQDTLSSLVVDEEYSQQVTEYRASGPLSPRRRQLRSEMLLLRAPADNVWLSFRDVIAVDGKPIGDRQRRFDALFSGPVAMMQSTAERIAEEGARFNLGQLRTINTPTSALVFLHPAYEANTRWGIDANERLDGRPVWDLSFDQRKPPFAVKVPVSLGHSASGKFRLEPDTGRIIAWELNVYSGRSIFRVKMRYDAVPSIHDGWMPVRMEDDYDMPRFERFRGVATYSNYRLFRTGVRIIGPAF